MDLALPRPMPQVSLFLTVFTVKVLKMLNIFVCGSDEHLEHLERTVGS